MPLRSCQQQQQQPVSRDTVLSSLMAGHVKHNLTAEHVTHHHRMNDDIVEEGHGPFLSKIPEAASKNSWVSWENLRNARLRYHKWNEWAVHMAHTSMLRYLGGHNSDLSDDSLLSTTWTVWPAEITEYCAEIRTQYPTSKMLKFYRYDNLLSGSYKYDHYANQISFDAVEYEMNLWLWITAGGEATAMPRYTVWVRGCNWTLVAHQHDGQQLRWILLTFSELRDKWFHDYKWLFRRYKVAV